MFDFIDNLYKPLQIFKRKRMSDRGVTTSTNVLACFIHPKYSFFFFFSVFPSREIFKCKKETKAINVGKFFQKETQTPKNTLKKLIKSGKVFIWHWKQLNNIPFNVL